MKKFHFHYLNTDVEILKDTLGKVHGRMQNPIIIWKSFHYAGTSNEKLTSESRVFNTTELKNFGCRLFYYQSCE
jgi:hypothetical protein